MIVYLIAFILALAGAFHNYRMDRRVRWIFLGVIWAYVVVVLGLRFRVGVDTISYMISFKHVKPITQFFQMDFTLQRYEPGYLLVCSLCRTFSKDFWLLQMVMAAITNACIFIFLQRSCRNVFVGLLVFFAIQWLYLSMEVIREGTAIGIFLLNYRNLEEKRWLRYYLFSLLSIAFHYSAIVIWLFPLACLLKPNATYLTFCILALAVTPVFEFIGDRIAILSVAKRIHQYLSITEYLNINWRLGEFIRSAFPALAVLAVCRFYRLKADFRSMLLLQILFCIGAFAIPVIFSRFTNYTSIFVTVALANILMTETVAKTVRTALVCFVLLTQSYWYVQMYPRWVPYVSVFNPKRIHEREQIWKNDFIFNGFRF